MKPIVITEMGYTPGVRLDPKTGVLEMTGKACPEDAIDFYKPILEWLEEYSKNPHEETIYYFKLSYYNTASSKVILTIMQKLEKIRDEGHNVRIKWYYFEDDEEMLNAGEDFADMIKVPFDLISIE